MLNMNRREVEEFTDEEKQELKEAVEAQEEGYNGPIPPMPEEKHNVHKFLTNVVMAEDTTKVGNLLPEEVGMAKYPVRTCQELSLFCDTVADKPGFSDYFKKEGEVVLATSLSIYALLIKLAVTTNLKTQRKLSLEDKNENKGWFKKNNDTPTNTWD